MQYGQLGQVGVEPQLLSLLAFFVNKYLVTFGFIKVISKRQCLLTHCVIAQEPVFSL